MTRFYYPSRGEVVYRFLWFRIVRRVKRAPWWAR